MSRVAGSGEIAGSDRRPWIGLWLAVLLVHLVLAVHAARIETPTVDEFAHLPAGCAAWTSGNFDLYAKSPPLARLWMSLPVALEPGKTYAIWINSEKFNNFKDTDGRSAVPYLLVFRTKK